jgi:hypothetical protein
MLEVNGQEFMQAVSNIEYALAVIRNVGTDEQRSEKLDQKSREDMVWRFGVINSSAQRLHANLTCVSISRVLSALNNESDISWKEIEQVLSDIRSRLNDELGQINLFVIEPALVRYLKNGADLTGPLVCDRLPSVIFEIEEACKCLVMGRPTASAFHSMRALEIGIKVLAKYLDVPDPVKPAERNWNFLLRNLKGNLDEKYSSELRLPGSEGAKMESLYATLDAVKNPWRNATMHVDATYQPFEADHILQAVHIFLIRLAEICSEDGSPAPQPSPGSSD